MNTNYPQLTISEVRDFVDSVVRLKVSREAVEGFFLRKNYPAISSDERKIEELVTVIVTECQQKLNSELEPIEARFSSQVFKLLDVIDDAALGDEKFWSYVAVRFFWPFIHLRQNSAWLAAEGKPQDPNEQDSEKLKLERYLIGKDHYQLPLRMYLRAQSIQFENDFDLSEVPGTDFWRSQILGVRTSVYPPFARSVAKAQREMELDVQAQRPPGRRVNRLRANLEMACFTEVEAWEIVRPLWEIKPGDEVKSTRKRATKVK